MNLLWGSSGTFFRFVNRQQAGNRCLHFMTTYLTKIENGKTHHFRTTVENNGVAIVHGIFYNWLAKYWEGCGDNASAITRQKQLVDEKLKEGFKITEFKETL